MMACLFSFRVSHTVSLFLYTPLSSIHLDCNCPARPDHFNNEWSVLLSHFPLCPLVWSPLLILHLALYFSLHTFYFTKQWAVNGSHLSSHLCSSWHPGQFNHPRSHPSSLSTSPLPSSSFTFFFPPSPLPPSFSLIITGPFCRLCSHSLILLMFSL